MIYNIWIVLKSVGICIFHKTYGGVKVDPDLFSGFLSGIYTFTEEISESGGIDQMDLKNMRLLYGLASNLIFIISASLDEDQAILRKILSKISSDFLEDYKNQLETWDGTVFKFNNFVDKLNLTIEKMRPLDYIEVPIKLSQKKRLKLTDEEFEVLSMCDGENSIDSIKNRLKLPDLVIFQILRKLEKKKIILMKLRQKK